MTDVVMPQMGESIDEGTIVRWVKKVGDTVDYALVATNDGSVTLTGVAISDPRLPALVCTPAQPATLVPGATLTCTGTHTISQADVDAGVSRSDNARTTWM